MVPNEIGIPETQRQKQCAIVGLTGMNDEYHLRLLDKDAEKEELESKFINEFLNAEKIVDDKHKTKVFKNSAETWITKDRKSTRLNSSHANISYAVFCLKKKKK